MSNIEKFLGAIEGSTVPYVEASDDAENPYCDSCADPIHPNTNVQLYGTDKLLTGHQIPGGFRALRMHCEDCHLPRLYLPCKGFDEYLVDATVDEEWSFENPEIVDVSPASKGIPYDPKAIMEDLFGMPYDNVMVASGFESQGPLDALDVLVMADIDPREVISDDGQVTVTPTHMEKFDQTMNQLLDERNAGNTPPEVNVADKLSAFLNTEAPE